MEDEDVKAQNVKFALGVAIERGSYADPEAPGRIESLVSERRLREALWRPKLGVDRRPTCTGCTWGMRLRGLGLDERAVFYRQRYEEAQVENENFMTRVFDEIEATLKSTTGVRDGFARIIDLCATSQPHSDWDRFRELDIESDIAHLERWMQGVLSSDPPGASITGLWFGLFNPIRQGVPTADLYVAGSPYDSDNEEGNIPLHWRPASEEAGSPVLHGIYRIAYPDFLAHGDSTEAAKEAYREAMKRLLGNDAEYPLCLAYAALAVRWLATQLEPELLLGGATERVLVTGFDSGDYICIGALTESGLRFSSETFRMA